MVDNSEKYLDPQTLAKLQGLRLRAKSMVDGYVAGQHRSSRQGFSTEFSEHREYVPGDDLRYLDWKLFGRTDKYFIKEFEDETNLVCYIILDASESMSYQGPDSPLSKIEYAKCLAATLSWLILQRRDAVSIGYFRDGNATLAQPSNQLSSIKNILALLGNLSPQGKTRFRESCAELASRIKKRCVILFLSDLLSETSTVVSGIKQFRPTKHDVSVLQILDAAEVEFPFARATKFRGLEALSDAFAHPKSVRKAYLEELDNHQTKIQLACNHQGFDYQLVSSSDNFDVPLNRLLARRATRN